MEPFSDYGDVEVSEVVWATGVVEGVPACVDFLRWFEPEGGKEAQVGGGEVRTCAAEVGEFVEGYLDVCEP